jgi:hypothetical protein
MCVCVCVCSARAAPGFMLAACVGVAGGELSPVFFLRCLRRGDVRHELTIPPRRPTTNYALSTASKLSYRMRALCDTSHAIRSRYSMRVSAVYRNPFSLWRWRRFGGGGGMNHSLPGLCYSSMALIMWVALVFSVSCGPLCIARVV